MLSIFTHVIMMLRDTHSEPGLPVLSVVDDIFFGGLAVVQEFFGEPGYLYGRKHLLDIFFPKAPHARFIFGSFFATQEFFGGGGNCPSPSPLKKQWPNRVFSGPGRSRVNFACISNKSFANWRKIRATPSFKNMPIFLRIAKFPPIYKDG